MLNLENIKTDRPTKKLDTKYTKYIILEAIGSYNFCLDILLEIYNIFFNKFLKLAVTDPFPSQQQDDTQKGPTLVGDQEKYEIKEILDKKRA